MHFITAWDTTEVADLIRDRLFCERTGAYVPYSHEEHPPDIGNNLALKVRDGNRETWYLPFPFLLCFYCFILFFPPLVIVCVRMALNVFRKCAGYCYGMPFLKICVGDFFTKSSCWVVCAFVCSCVRVLP